jgi:1-acyl-sn-glycerol-3-phosphate acyltransferase
VSDLSYFIGALGTRIATTLLTDTTVRDLDNIPASGPCLLVCNHISHFDPNILGMNFPRRGRAVDYMADLPLLQIPVAGRILKSWNAFPIDRTKPIDRAAIRATLERLAQGRIVGIFPEKGLRYGEKSILNGAPLPAGTAAIWKMAGVPALPALVFGTDQLYQWRYLFRRPRLFVYYGPLLPPPDANESREAASDRLTTAIRHLYAELQKEFRVRPCEIPRCPPERFSEI